MANREFKKGIYNPSNREKYKGSKLPFYRSAWEKKIMDFFDSHPSILEWSSEPFFIQYFNPVSNKICKYFPDFLIVYKHQDGSIHTEIIEVKPYKQTIPPKQSKNKRHSTLLIEAKMWATNSAKWKAAKAYCDTRGYSFRLITEKHLFN